MPAIRAIAEVVLNVRDIGVMTAFYRDVVGLAEYSRAPDDHPTIVFLEVAPLDPPLGTAHPQVLALIDPARHAPAKGKFDTPTRRTSTLNHVAFAIDTADHEPELARLASLGIETQVVRFPKMRAIAIFFKDPEQNTVELICHDPTA